MKTKKLWLTAISALMMAGIIGGCQDENVEVVGLCPEVVSTNPANLATGVQLDQVITVTFNEAMNPATITPEAFSLLGPGGAGARTAGVMDISGTVSYDEATFTMSFEPAEELLSETEYTGLVATTVKDMMGNALQVGYEWTFSTGTTPTVASTDPAGQAENVVLNKVVNVVFSQEMDAATISATSFTILNGTTAVSGEVTYAGSTATFAPDVDLLPGTEYSATITADASNPDGLPLENDFQWTFTTGVAPTVLSTSPADDATGVVINKVVRATFSEVMDPLTITTSSFTLAAGTTPVSGTASYSGTTASFTPAANLDAGVEYTATITTLAASANGFLLENDYVWTFTTGTELAPVVTLTDPLDQATDVTVDKVLSATFSELMDPLTITTSSFTLTAGTTPVSGVVGYSGSTATFTPNSDLLAGTTYTATITTAATSAAAVQLADDFVWTFSTPASVNPLFVDLKSVEEFGIIAGVGVSNNAGFSEIRDMNVGISPGVRSSITGFPPAIVVNGAIFASDDSAPAGVAAMLTQAKQDLTDAYLFAEGASTPAPATVAGDLGGTTLAPGIYKSTSTLLIQSGDLTLDAQGDPNAVWIFQIASDFTTVGGAGGNVILSGGAQAKNVFWQTGSSATIGDNTSFKGNVLALTSITMNSGATAEGRMLARNGSVVLTNANIINKP